ncbi:MAG: hypothetical protein ABI462_06065 [Ignavibacteria bacterium]
MKKIKLVSDFDGIWTDQKKESEHVWNYIVSSAAELSGKTQKDTRNFFRLCRQRMDKDPGKYGWVNAGEIAAFYKEDPYGDNNAIFDFMDRVYSNFPPDDLTIEIKKVRTSILAKYKSLAEYSQECFAVPTGRHKSEGKLKPVTSAADTVKKINSLNTDIVVVSNSTTDKIKYLFAQAGIIVSGDALGKRESVHARGDAKKFFIYNSDTVLPSYLEISGKIKVPLRRSSYHSILIEEKPDFVVGDVFSLDIALPLYLRMNKREFSNLKVIQKIQPYTPAWVKDYLNKKDFKGKAFTINKIEELPEIISMNMNK